MHIVFFQLNLPTIPLAKRKRFEEKKKKKIDQATIDEQFRAGYLCKWVRVLWNPTVGVMTP